MAIRLIRESSETPNITNQDDARMARYAYSGYTGYVKNHLSEVGYQTDGSKFILKGGVVVVNGWEVAIEEGSWELDLSILSGTQYYTVYLAVNLATETAEIRSVYAPGAYPTISEGDDLTEDPYGEANVVLYHVKSDGGKPSSVIKIIEPIPYLNEKVADLEERLERLGFKEGELTFTEYALNAMLNPPTKNIVKRQGNYVIIETEFYMTIQGNEKIIIAIIPDEFRPKEDIIVFMNQVFLTVGLSTMVVDRVVRVNKDGEISLNFENIIGSGLYDAGTIGNLSFGYETNPL